jgi:hypothetical protein
MMQKLTTAYETRITSMEQKYADAFKQQQQQQQQDDAAAAAGRHMMTDTEMNTFITKSTTTSTHAHSSSSSSSSLIPAASVLSAVNNNNNNNNNAKKTVLAELRSDASYHSSEESQPSESSDDSEDDEKHGNAEANRLKKLDESHAQQAESIADTLIRLEDVSIVKMHEEMCDVLKYITPTERQYSYLTNQIFAFLRGQTRLSCNASLFGMGLSEIGCNLPDDMLQYSVLLSKNHFPTWHTSLCERLVAVSEGNVDAWLDTPDNFNNNNNSNNNSNSLKVSEVKYTSDDTSSSSSSSAVAFSVRCTVDDVHHVVIAANKRHDLCWLAFYEEVSSLVGKQALFKRALLLIRAWWQYETATYLDRAVAHYLPEHVLCLMVCMVFNKYHARLETPSQVLLFFLAEFVQYHGKKHVITLQGIVPYTHHHQHQGKQQQPLQLIPPHPRHLLGVELLEKYWHLFNIGTAALNNNNNINNNNNNNPGATSDSLLMMHNNHNNNNNNNSSKSQYNPYHTHTAVSFDRVGFNVLHPFTHVSMVTEKLSARRAELIAKVFLLGATNFATHLKQAEITVATNITTSNVASSFSSSFFPNVVLKFSPAYQSELLRYDHHNMR